MAARGLTQDTMAERLGVSQAEVSKLEVIAARFGDGVEVPIRLSAEGNAA